MKYNVELTFLQHVVAVVEAKSKSEAIAKAKSFDVVSEDWHRGDLVSVDGVKKYETKQ